MSVYTLEQGLWPKNRKKLIINQSLIWGAGVLGGFFVSFIQISPQRTADIIAVLTRFALLTMAYGTAAVLFTIWKVFKAKKRYQTFELVMSEDSIVRKQFGMPEITIKKQDITRVQAVEGKGFMVRTADPICMMWIPDELIGYEDVTAVLMEWAPAEAPRTTFPLLFNVRAGVAIAVVGMLAIFLVPSPTLVTLAAVLLVGFLLYAALYALRSPNCTDSSFKIISTTLIATAFIVIRVMTVWR